MKKFLVPFTFFFFFFFVLGFSGFYNKTPVQSNQKIIEVGEEITYVVKYLAFEIGEIKLKVVKIEVDGNDTLYNAIAFIDSYDGIPFADLHQIYETKFNAKQISHYFKGSVLAKDTTYTKYIFNKSKNNIHIV